MRSTKSEATSKMSWLEEPEMPRREEIMAREAPLLPHNQVDAPPGNKAQYLETQYRLLRYEGTELLRRAVQEFRDDPSMMESKDTAIYTNVLVHGYFVSRIGTLCRIGFCPSRVDKNIRWKHSARLTPGTIVALSTTEDKFKSICMVASVVQKDLVGGLEPDLNAGEHKDTPPRIDIAWADPQDAVLDPQMELIMVEARNGYYESVRHTLQGLQERAQYPSPFERYLIDGNSAGRAPRYLEELDHTVDLTPIVAADATTGGSSDPDLHHSVSVKNAFPASIRNLTSLDSSQLSALRHVLTSELAVVQGPPGTGKTFTSVSALKILLANINSSKHPIIVAAQTNHALDQILLLLTKATKTGFVRLGRRSQDESIASCTVYNFRKKSQKNVGGAELGRIESQRKTHITAIKDLIGECFPEGLLNPSDLLAYDLISHAQYDSLEGDGDQNPFVLWLDNVIERCRPHIFTQKSAKWEEVEDPDAHGDQAITIDDDERDRLSGQYIPILERWKGRVDSQMLRPALWKRTQAMLRRYQNLWQVPREYRGAVYRYLRNQYIEAKTNDLRNLIEESIQLAKDGKACRAKFDSRIIQNFRIPVIGCTTTGLTKYRRLIESLEPQVMLIEEAAETREANITSALFPSLEQLILVGDHMQLTPHTNLSELSCHPYNLCLSLFERMINLKMSYAVLSVQRRMVPEIRHILKPFYPGLQDHDSVLDKDARPPVPGMGNISSYFFCHRWPENRTRQESRVNMDEARMIVGFVRYLVQNGTSAAKITILTFYRGQRGLILDQLSRDIVLNNIYPPRKYNVYTVDGYQGEENDVIILSLVRSPDNHNPCNVGFLDIRNRVVVALSRARRGLYVFGNYRNLMGASDKARKVWKPSLDVLAQQDRCHSRLLLSCQRHGNSLKVKSPQDWDSLHGGCRKKCAATLECGHRCQMLCHPFSHDKVTCRQPCNQKLPCGHGCSEVCSDECRCGKTCDYIPEVRKRANANFVTLDEFLKPKEDTAEEIFSPTAEEDVAQDLISVWSDEDVISNSNAAVSQVDGRSASPNVADYQNPSEMASEGNRHAPGAGSEATTHEFGSGAPSRITPGCSSGCPSEKSSLGGNKNHESGSATDNVDRASQGSRNGQVINKTFREVRIRRGYRREEVAVHRSKVVHAPQPENPAKGARKIDSPEPLDIPVKTPQSPPPDDMLIDFSDTPVCPVTVLTMAEAGDGDHAPENNSVVLGKLENGINTVITDEYARSEVSDLIAF